MLPSWSLILIVTLPFLGGLVAGFLPTGARTTAAVLAGGIAVTALVLVALGFPQIADGQNLRFEAAWLPSLGLNFVLRLNGLTGLFASLVLAIGALVILYARYYMSPKDPVPRFFSFLLCFMGSMLGVVLSGNLVQLAFFWELTSLFSFLLIGYWHHNQSARDGARMALITTAAGGVCLLVGLLLLGRMAGSYDIDMVLASRTAIQGDALYLPALILILLGAFTKSAQFPFHFWLPHAMAAPTPVSAYLHSATMVKAGIFLMILLWPVLSGSQAWFVIVTSAGLATLLFGAWAAIFQQDLKGLLAYSTISHLGLITLLLGLSSPLAAVAAIFHTVNHATFKASLFMAAGIIDHETGTRDLRRLSGLARYMPITATLAIIAAAAMAGVPLLNGFLSKEMFLAEALDAHSGTIIDVMLPWLATLASTFSVFYSVRFIHQTFFGPPPVDLPKTPHEAPKWMRLPVEILVLTCLLVGIFPALTIGPFLRSAVTAMMGAQAPDYSLAIWHGFNLPLAMSLFALVAGCVGYFIFGPRLNARENSPVIGRFRARRTFDMVLEFAVEISRKLVRLLGTRRLQAQLRLLVITAFAFGALPFAVQGFEWGSLPVTLIDPVFAVIWGVAAVCALVAGWKAKFHRVVALVLVSVAGLATCISFVWLSAPDLGLTQLVVETVTLVLLLLSLRWLPQRREAVEAERRVTMRERMRRGADVIIAAIGGTGMAIVAFGMMTRPTIDNIGAYFIDRAYPEGGGTNVVNVILVDFRGFDTLGEITVLSIVALTVYSLLRRFRPAPESMELPTQQQRQNAFDDAREDRDLGDTLRQYIGIPRVTMEWLFPVILTFSLYLLLRGHDLPGGGFAAGVTASIAIILLYVSNGTRWVEARLNVQPVRWMSLGLLATVLVGAAAWIFGYPFLTTYFQYVSLPVIGKMPVASALIFDIGVFAVVVGTTVLILIAIAHQSIRAPRVAKPDAAKAEEGKADAEAKTPAPTHDTATGGAQ